MKRFNTFLVMLVVLVFAATLFSAPDEIAGLKTWLDASTIDGLSSGDPVQYWYDQSGNDYDAVQNTFANRPLYITEAINSFPVVRFDGSNDYMTITSDTGLNMTAFSIAVVLKINNNGNNIQVITSKEGTGSDPWNNRNWWYAVNSNPATAGAPAHRIWFRTSAGGATANGVNIYSSAAHADGEYLITMVTFVGLPTNDGTAVLYINDNPDMSSNTARVPDVTQPYVQIGAQGNIQRYLNGDIAELLIYEGALSSDDREALNEYLYNKYFVEQEPPLAIELSSFTASLITNNYVQLRWVTESETNFLGYNVFRGTENSISGAYKVNPLIINGSGSSSIQQIYTFTDENVEMNTLYYYWLEAIDLDMTTAFHGPISIQTSLEEDPETPPEVEYVTRLIGAYPNPFNPGTNIRFELDQPETVSVIIYNVLGQQVKYLSDNFQTGEHSLFWDGTDNKGNPSNSGIYFYRFMAGSRYQQYNKMILLK